MIELFLLFCLTIVMMTRATELVVEPLMNGKLRQLQSHADVCKDSMTYTQQSAVFIEIIWDPDELYENGHKQVLEDAFQTVYDNIASKACDVGYRDLSYTQINEDWVTRLDSGTRQFTIKFDLVGSCKGCSNDLRFFASYSGERVDSRNLRKSTKKSKMSKSARCFCTSPTIKEFREAFRNIVHELVSSERLSDIEILRIGEYNPMPSKGSKKAKSSKTSSRKSKKSANSVINLSPTTEMPTTVLLPTDVPSTRLVTSDPTEGSVTSPSSATNDPTVSATDQPTLRPVIANTSPPTTLPEISETPSVKISQSPTEPTLTPTISESSEPTLSTEPTESETAIPTEVTPIPTIFESNQPTLSTAPTESVSAVPTELTPTPTISKSSPPTSSPEPGPTEQPHTSTPSSAFTGSPISAFSESPTISVQPSLPTNYRSSGCDNGEQPGFQICLEILGVPNGDEAIFDAAVGAWESVITNDLPNFIPPVAFMDSICPPGERYNPPADGVDIYICGRFEDIDGVDGILGRGVTVFLAEGLQPTQWGSLVIDSADLSFLQSDPVVYQDTVFHEIGISSLPICFIFGHLPHISHTIAPNLSGHVLGIGNSWERPDASLVDRDRCVYTGTNGREKYQQLSSCSTEPPIECDSGHWSESCFVTEVMTPTQLVGTPSTLSEMTLGSLEDIGYSVNYDSTEVDYIADELDSSCNCNTRRINSYMRGKERPQRKHPSQEGMKKARAHALSTIQPALEAGMDVTSTVLFREDGVVFEVRV